MASQTLNSNVFYVLAVCSGIRFPEHACSALAVYLLFVRKGSLSPLGRRASALYSLFMAGIVSITLVLHILSVFKMNPVRNQIYAPLCALAVCFCGLYTAKLVSDQHKADRGPTVQFVSWAGSTMMFYFSGYKLVSVELFACDFMIAFICISSALYHIIIIVVCVAAMLSDIGLSNSIRLILFVIASACGFATYTHSVSTTAWIATFCLVAVGFVMIVAMCKSLGEWGNTTACVVILLILGTHAVTYLKAARHPHSGDDDVVIHLSHQVPTICKNEFLVENRFGNKNPYPVCGLRWQGLNVIDLSLASYLAYEKKEQRVMQAALWFGDRHVEVIHRDDNCSGEGYKNSKATFLELYFNATDTSVVSVRGTDDADDIVQDMLMWGTSVFSRAIAVDWLLPQRIRMRIVGILSVWDSVFPTGKYYHDAVVKCLTKYPPKGKTLLFTGHSLGGGVASVLAAIYETSAVVFSAPGVLNQIRTQSLHRLITVVLPDNDIIQAIETYSGAEMHIDCDAGNPKACHMLSTTICELKRSCGQGRIAKLTQQDLCDFCTPH